MSPVCRSFFSPTQPTHPKHPKRLFLKIIGPRKFTNFYLDCISNIYLITYFKDISIFPFTFFWNPISLPEQYQEKSRRKQNNCEQATLYCCSTCSHYKPYLELEVKTNFKKTGKYKVFSQYLSPIGAVCSAVNYISCWRVTRI